MESKEECGCLECSVCLCLVETTKAVWFSGINRRLDKPVCQECYERSVRQKLDNYPLRHGQCGRHRNHSGRHPIQTQTDYEGDWGWT